jgi:hypothetical protein
MQRLMDDARREESTWPRHHWLWATSPLMEWLGDHLRRLFGRHGAPVLSAPAAAPPGGAVFLLSAQCPSRRGDPLVHAWYAVTQPATGAPTLAPFAEFLPGSGLTAPLSNPGLAGFDAESLRPALRQAVALARTAILAERDAWLAREQPRTDAELARLEARRGRQLAFYFTGPGAEPGDPASQAAEVPAILARRQASQRARIEARYRELSAWMRDARTPVGTPFLQVVGVLLGART